MSLLGIDVGTTATKAVAFDLSGRQLASASREYPLHSPAPGQLELDANVVWEAVAACLREVNDVLMDPVETLAISSQGEAVTPIAADGTILAGSPVTFDTRAVAQSGRLEAAIGRERLAYLTGQPPHPMYTIAKLMWWAEHEPDLVAHTWKFLCFGDLVAWKLGGEAAIDLSMAARTMAFDIHACRWSEEILAAADIPIEKLPTPVRSGTRIGRVDAALARELGFIGAPTIVAGGHDQPCAAFGAGAATQGEAMLSIGTTICLAPVFDHPAEKLVALDYPCYPHVAHGRWISLAGNFTGGSLIRWYRDTLGEAEVAMAEASGRDVYDVLTEVAGDEPSPLLVLPHFAGSGAPSNDPRSKGAIIGLGFGTTKAQIVRALLEGVMFEMALNREMLVEAGVAIEQAVAVGGGARSDRWLQIAADVLDIPIRRSPHREAACWGAAHLAAEGARLLVRCEAAGLRASSPAFVPDPQRSGYYRERLGVYRELYRALQPVNAAL
jgi:xylulokinase